jgi:hypothetical protein
MGALIRATLSAAGVVAALLLGGCEWFRPDDPEAPQGGGAAIVPNYAEPDSVLETMARAIENKGRSNGQAAYIGAFADTTADVTRGFHAFFDPQTVNRMEQRGIVIPDDWDHDDEEAFYSRLVTLPSVPANSAFVLQWSEDVSQGEDEIAAETARLYRKYTITAITAEGADLITVALGLATLDLVKLSTTRWAIVTWQDREWPGANLENGEISFGQRRLEP